MTCLLVHLVPVRNLDALPSLHLAVTARRTQYNARSTMTRCVAHQQRVVTARHGASCARWCLPIVRCALTRSMSMHGQGKRLLLSMWITSSPCLRVEPTSSAICKGFATRATAARLHNETGDSAMRDNGVRRTTEARGGRGGAISERSRLETARAAFYMCPQVGGQGFPPAGALLLCLAEGCN